MLYVEKNNNLKQFINLKKKEETVPKLACNVQQ